MPKPSSTNQRRPVKSLGMIVLGLLSTLYLANPTWGVFEFLPDNIPGVGNIDEALAALLLFRVLAYFGINLIDRTSTGDGGPVIDIDGPGNRKK